MTPALSATRSASLPVAILQISTIIRSISIHHSASRCNVHDCIDCHGAYNNVAPVYCRNALDHCKHACQMTPARSATRSASLRVTIEQISTIRRSIGVHRSAIRCNVHDCIDLYGVEYPGSCCNDAMMWIVPVDDSGGLCVPNQ